MSKMTGGSSVAPADQELAAIRRIPAARAAVLVEGGYATLVDVRYRGSCEGGHIEGALSVSLKEIERAPQLSRLGGIPENHLLILYCT